MAWRLLLGSVWIAGISLVLYVDTLLHAAHSPVILILGIVLSLRASHELTKLLQHQHINCSTTANLATLLVAISPWIHHIWDAEFRLPDDSKSPFFSTFIALMAALMAIFISRAKQFVKPGNTMIPLAADGFMIVYLGVPLAVIGLLRLQGPDLSPNASLLPLIATLVIIKGTDTGAYSFGKLIGKNKLAPILSPGKTIEGAIGGIAFGVGGGLLVLYVIPQQVASIPVSVSLSWIITAAIFTSVSGQIGDLAESLIKRDVQQKDSAPLMPGLGGVLDLLDSLLMAAPIAYFFWIIRW